jgi:restriction system protein
MILIQRLRSATSCQGTSFGLCFVCPMPRHRRSIFEDLTALPWWVGAVLSLILAAIGSRANPGSPLKAVYLLSVVCGGAAVISFVQTWWQDRLLAKQTSVASLADLTWGGFEEMLAAAFRREGFSVKVTGSSGADGGVDLVLRRGEETTLVQAKHWRRDVNVQVVRELYGVMAAEKASHGIVVTSGHFTVDARAFAATLPIELLDGERLAKRIGLADVPAHQQVNPAERLCPSCRAPMVLRVARNGPKPGSQFLGCSRFPSCRATPALGA